jgi:hypothetical protein
MHRILSWDNANSYLYAGASADFVYAVNATASLGAGLNFTYNDDNMAKTRGGVFCVQIFC